ncbi:uncharacterized protein Bfra_007192 [Botrytis fragariae]|uniref:Uncharacterized protein n=1 Tax=Botrytis fragariae TaxID=1964551 RepID=A0A8H6AIN1_9HELO|nr:uncharacterized protein Bfra_007192 [Botrytis fragariae]KAF5867996.1 hypothetical protein Bfra_007192 [Botrytis fragariae]
MSGLMPSDDEDEYGNIIRRAPVKYSPRLMNRSPSSEPQPAKDYASCSKYFQPESEERERLEEIEDTKRAVKERAEEDEANRIAQTELGCQVEEKKAVNLQLQADSDHRAVTNRVTKVLRKTSIFEPKYEAENGEGSSKGSGKGIGRGNAKK